MRSGNTADAKVRAWLPSSYSYLVIIVSLQKKHFFYWKHFTTKHCWRQATQVVAINMLVSRNWIIFSLVTVETNHAIPDDFLVTFSHLSSAFSALTFRCLEKLEVNLHVKHYIHVATPHTWSGPSCRSLFLCVCWFCCWVEKAHMDLCRMII